MSRQLQGEIFKSIFFFDKELKDYGRAPLCLAAQNISPGWGEVFLLREGVIGLIFPD